MGTQHSQLDGREELGLEDILGLEFGAGLALEQEVFLCHCHQDLTHDLAQVHTADELLKPIQGTASARHSHPLPLPLPQGPHPPLLARVDGGFIHHMVEVGEEMV